MSASIALVVTAVACEPSIAIERVSVSSTGQQAGDRSEHAAISADGRHVAFVSYATNLVPGDGNGQRDIFVHDRETGLTERVSVDSTGAEGNNASRFPAISTDGRFIAFESDASNLVAGDVNGDIDTFVHDRATQMTERIGLNARYPAISGDGRYIVFESSDGLVAEDTNGFNDIYVYDRDMGTTERVSVGSDGTQGDDDSDMPGGRGSLAISADGRYVVFESDAGNLVADDTNGFRDVFLRDRVTLTTERISVDSAGAEANLSSGNPAISADGFNVAFESQASNLVPADTNGVNDIFVRNRKAGTTVRVSVDSMGAEGSSFSFSPDISFDGRFTVFETNNALVPDDVNGNRDVYVHDQTTGGTVRLEAIGLEGQGNGGVTPQISDDGRYVSFQSSATNLVAGDTNGDIDIFVHDSGRNDVPLPPDAMAGDRFGDAVATDGNLFAVGRPNANGGSGDVVIYRVEGGRLVQDAVISVPDGHIAGAFGAALALEGDRLVVGAPGATQTKGLSTLQAAILQRLAGAWTMIAEIKSDTTGDAFGSAVALHGTMVVIGAPGDDDDAPDSGAAHVFVFDESGNQIANRKLKPQNAADGDKFGHAVAVDRGQAAVGAPGGGPNGTGLVHLYGQLGTNLADLVDRGSLTGSDSRSGDEFGAAIALDGGLLAVGSPGEDGTGTDSGATYVFDPQSLSQRARVEPRIPRSEAAFGRSVALAAGRLAVGAPGFDNVGSVFRFNPALGPADRIEAPIGRQDFGAAVALSRDGLIVGAPETAGQQGAALVLRDPGLIFAGRFE